jgi:hypothetical protein
LSELNDLLEKTAKVSPFVWITTNLNLPKGMSWDFQYRRWQIPIINDMAKNQAIMKPAQVGLSTIEFCKMLYLAYMIPMRLAYVLPRDKDYEDMVSTRANPIINSSPLITERMTESDSLSRKQLGESFLHFLSSSTEPRMLDIDTLIIDETDLSNQEYLELYSARLYASKYKIRYDLSVPSTPNRGIDSLMQHSTWNIWNVKCPYCGKWIPFDSNWLSVLKVAKHRIYYGGNCCDMCKDIGLNKNQIAEGRWIPSFPNRSISGYQVIRTMDSNTSADELHRIWKTTRIEKHFYTSALGLPYVADNLILDKDSILQWCADTDVKKEEFGKKGKYYIGVDQGNNLHLVVLKEAEEGLLQLVRAEVLEEAKGNPFKQAERIIASYPNAHVLCDLLPNTHAAKELIGKFKNGKVANYQFSLTNGDGFYADSKTSDRLVIIQKHEALDELITKYIKGQQLRMYTNDGVVDSHVSEVALHISALQRSIQTRKQHGLGERVFSVWEPSGPDHFAMCLVFAMVAYQRTRSNPEKRFRWSLLG